MPMCSPASPTIASGRVIRQNTGVSSSSAPVVLLEGADQLASGSATDAAGNVRTATFGPVDIDLALLD